MRAEKEANKSHRAFLPQRRSGQQHLWLTLQPKTLNTVMHPWTVFKLLRLEIFSLLPAKKEVS